ncbi:MAG TPA: hypothetical protein VJ571_03045 [Candidatus Nitrosotalea sp.]|nr:hypothetical protein [Candidatus Nitrosotalea sp.]
MLKINSLMIVTVILASSMILPVGLSYAQTYGGQMQPSSSGNQTSMNQTMTNSTHTNSTMTMTTNSTSANSTMAIHDNATMKMTANSTSTNSTMGMPMTHTMTNMTTPSSTPAAPSGPMSPLMQFKSGVSAKSVTCQSGYSLVVKAEDGSPACVHSSTVQVLILRGWATAQ